MLAVHFKILMNSKLTVVFYGVSGNEPPDHFTCRQVPLQASSLSRVANFPVKIKQRLHQLWSKQLLCFFNFSAHNFKLCLYKSSFQSTLQASSSRSQMLLFLKLEIEIAPVFFSLYTLLFL